MAARNGQGVRRGPTEDRAEVKRAGWMERGDTGDPTSTYGRKGTALRLMTRLIEKHCAAEYLGHAFDDDVSD